MKEVIKLLTKPSHSTFSIFFSIIFINIIWWKFFIVVLFIVALNEFLYNYSRK